VALVAALLKRRPDLGATQLKSQAGWKGLSRLAGLIHFTALFAAIVQSDRLARAVLVLDQRSALCDTPKPLALTRRSKARLVLIKHKADGSVLLVADRTFKWSRETEDETHQPHALTRRSKARSILIKPMARCSEPLNGEVL